MEYFKGKKVFITGGSMGIGEAMARLCAGWGADVYIAARRQAQLDTALAGIKAARPAGNYGTVSVDVGDHAAMKAAAQTVIDGLGGLDILINNAGYAHPATLAETPDEVFEAMMRVNYFGVVNSVRAFQPHFCAQQHGVICNVSSMLGFMGIYGYSAYAASKHAVVGFSDCLRQELLDYGVQLTVVMPPDTETPGYAIENETKPAETMAISGEVKAMSPDAVALSALKGIAKGRYHVIPGFDGALTYWAYRHMPGFVRWYIDFMLKRYRKTHPAPAVKAA